jgi:Gas vesicle synthesis protein GvpO
VISSTVSMAESKKSLSPPEAVGRARRQMEELFGKPVESVSGFGRPEDNGGGWTVTLELLELPRIPDTTSLLGTYEATLDADGNLLDARRVRRYPRNQYDPIDRGEDS